MMTKKMTFGEVYSDQMTQTAKNSDAAILACFHKGGGISLIGFQGSVSISDFSFSLPPGSS